MVPRTRAGIVWELGNGIMRRDVPGCIALIDQLFGQGENAVGILLVAMIPTIRNLLLVKDLMARYRLRPPAKPFFFGNDLAKLPPEATAHLPRSKKDGAINAYPLGLAACGAHHFSVAELVDFYDACLEANVKLVSSSIAPRIVLEELILRLGKKA
jgi:DNA polymerase-3 subunit delta